MGFCRKTDISNLKLDIEDTIKEIELSDDLGKKEKLQMELLRKHVRQKNVEKGYQKFCALFV